MFSPLFCSLAQEPASGSSRVPFIIGIAALAFAAMMIAKMRRDRALRRSAEGSGAEPSRTMGATRFWSLVAEAKEAAGSDPQHRPAALQRLLKNLEADDIERFDARYREVREKSATAALRTAAHLIRGLSLIHI